MFDYESKTKRYPNLGFLGEGQFAKVYKARDEETGEIVAVKKLKLGTKEEAKDGINRTALREIKILQEISHPNICALLDVFGQRSNVSLVFEFMSTDLEVMIKDDKILITPAHIKSYLIMTLKGVRYLHTNWILHRDLKPNNLLIDRHGVLKLGDFGLAKTYGSPREYTHQVVTRWYRAPELLLGSRFYGPGIDVWAIGCILGELLFRQALLPGDNDLDQLGRIFRLLGTPTEQSWPGFTLLPDYVELNHQPGCDLSTVFTAASNDCVDVIASMLLLDPNRRLSCNQLLQMPYFTNKPYPTPTEHLPKTASMMEGGGGDASLRPSKRPGGDFPGASLSAKRLHFD